MSSERERIVETSAGSVLVRRISWAGWKIVKSQVLRFLESRLAELIKNASLPGGESPSQLGWSILPMLARTVAEESDQWVGEFLKACGVPAEILDGLDAIDMVQLRDAAVAVSEFETLVEAEKNLLAQLVLRTLQAVGMPAPQLPSLSPTPGGSPS
jgi:hypothetical protein